MAGNLLDGDAGDDLELEKNRRPLCFGILVSREGPLLTLLVEDLDDSPDTCESLILFSDETSLLRSIDLAWGNGVFDIVGGAETGRTGEV